MIGSLAHALYLLRYKIRMYIWVFANITDAQNNIKPENKEYQVIIISWNFTVDTFQFWINHRPKKRGLKPITSYYFTFCLPFKLVQI